MERWPEFKPMKDAELERYQITGPYIGDLQEQCRRANKLVEVLCALNTIISPEVEDALRAYLGTEDPG